jgi:hypothetical protein
LSLIGQEPVAVHICFQALLHCIHIQPAGASSLLNQQLNGDSTNIFGSSHPWEKPLLVDLKLKVNKIVVVLCLPQIGWKPMV